MAKKTVLKKLLSNFGLISIDLQGAALATALQADQAVITEDGLRYVDNERGDEKIVPFSDVIELPDAEEYTETDNLDEPDDENPAPDDEREQ